MIANVDASPDAEQAGKKLGESFDASPNAEEPDKEQLDSFEESWFNLKPEVTANKVSLECRCPVHRFTYNYLPFLFFSS